MDDYEYQLAASRLRETAGKAATSDAVLRVVGRDFTTNETLLIDDSSNELYLRRMVPEVQRGAVRVVTKTTKAVLLQAPFLLQVLITGMYGGPPKPILAEFEGEIMRFINVDALRL
jgi:hypothetical protein